MKEDYKVNVRNHNGGLRSVLEDGQGHFLGICDVLFCNLERADDGKYANRHLHLRGVQVTDINFLQPLVALTLAEIPTKRLKPINELLISQTQLCAHGRMVWNGIIVARLKAIIDEVFKNNGKPKYKLENNFGYKGFQLYVDFRA